MPRRTPPSPLPAEPYWQGLPGSRGLLHTVAEEPWDEGLRLILADWLDDHGETARAQFIRLQVQRQRLPDWDRSYQSSDPLPAQEERLLEDNRGQWLAGLPHIEGVSWDGWYNFVGGLLENLWVAWGTLEVQVGELFAAADLRKLVVVPEAVDLARAVSPALLNFVRLFKWGGIGDKEAVALASFPFLARRCSLDLSGHNIVAEGAAALAASPHLAGLSDLDLSCNGIGDPGAAALAASRHLSALSTLDLHGNNIGDETAALLRGRWPFVRL
jgi:uncharacterized protein (TIGR02996 family)